MMSLWANAHDLAHQREVEELRREIGALRYEVDRLEQALRIANEDAEEYVAAGWRHVTTKGHVILDPHTVQPAAWGDRGHRIYVRASERA